MTTHFTITRFRYIDPTTDIIYVGEAEIEDGDVTILAAWSHGLTSEEVYPYDVKFPVVLRRLLEITAKEQAMRPPATPVELPTDWDEIEILDTETTYTIAAKSAALPNVSTDKDVQCFGLSTVRRIVPTPGAYRVTAKGGIDEVRRELHRIRIF